MEAEGSAPPGSGIDSHLTGGGGSDAAASILNDEGRLLILQSSEAQHKGQL